MTKLAIPKETFPGETRVAATPLTVAKMIKAGIEVLVETGAGLKSSFSDQAYQAVGADIESNTTRLMNQADILLKVQRPMLDTATGMNEVAALKENAIIIAPLNPLRNISLVQSFMKNKLTTFSLDLLPRIARAQSMDILSSMSNLAGYKSVILAADHLPKILPMMTTAAGTLLPAKVIVIGVGVAGLQAIATAKRLGAVVIAFDTRPATAEQVKSLGAEFVSMAVQHQTEDSAGYAKEQSSEFYQQEQSIIKKYLEDADIVITTALVPGKQAPLLITEKMVQAMKAGSVIVDLASEQGGNCELTEANKVLIKYNVTIMGPTNLPSTLTIHATQLYANNIFNFLNYIFPQIKASTFNLADDLINATLLTYNGEVMHPAVKPLLQEKD